MRVWVETDVGYVGVEMPRRFRFDDREIGVVENLDQWHGPDYRYFKLRGDDGNLYILRFDEVRVEWELTMFQNPRSQAIPAGFYTKRKPVGGVRM